VIATDLLVEHTQLTDLPDFGRDVVWPAVRAEPVKAQAPLGRDPHPTNVAHAAFTEKFLNRLTGRWRRHRLATQKARRVGISFDRGEVHLPCK
jgi:hypothetical protein